MAGARGDGLVSDANRGIGEPSLRVDIVEPRILDEGLGDDGGCPPRSDLQEERDTLKKPPRISLETQSEMRVHC